MPKIEQSSPEIEEASQTYIGRWNHLVSTTNWEKGRIIFQWREALAATKVPPAEYSDETWSQLVGGVTGQHVGRLRRVYDRFGENNDQFEGLYWSHFQAALDWEDAEMWLEGALQNDWSVSKMRRHRWETLGSLSSEKPSDSEIVVSELDEDFEPALSQSPDTASQPNSEELLTQELGTVQGSPVTKSQSPGQTTPSQKQELGNKNSKTNPSDEPGASVYAEQSDQGISFVRPFENLAELPDDLAEAFESFKLAILHHKAEDWTDISCDEVLASLDSLKNLTLAPTTGEM